MQDTPKIIRFPIKYVVPGMIILLCFILYPVYAESAGTRLLREVPGPGQEVKSRAGLPLIISKKLCNVAVSPESIMVEHGRLFRFTVIIVNLTDQPLNFSTKDIRVSAGQKDIDLVSEERIVEEERNEYSRETLNISKEEEKILSPYVKDKIQRLKNRLLKEQTVSPQKMLKGLIAIDLPMGSDNLTIEITTGKGHHRFDFNVMEL